MVSITGITCTGIKMEKWMCNYRLQWPRETQLSSSATQHMAKSFPLPWVSSHPGSCFTLSQGLRHTAVTRQGKQHCSVWLELHGSYLTLGTAPTAVPLQLPRPRLSPGLPAGVCPEPRGSQPKLTPPGKHRGGRCFAHVLTLTYLMSLKTSWCLNAFQYNGNCTTDNTRNKTSWNSLGYFFKMQ